MYSNIINEWIHGSVFLQLILPVWLILELMAQTPKARLTATKKSATYENSLLLLFVGKPQLKHVPAEK